LDEGASGSGQLTVLLTVVPFSSCVFTVVFEQSLGGGGGGGTSFSITTGGRTTMVSAFADITPSEIEDEAAKRMAVKYRYFDIGFSLVTPAFQFQPIQTVPAALTNAGVPRIPGDGRSTRQYRSQSSVFGACFTRGCRLREPA
jgi:hypothetical protein